jgi:hypothetical protein
LLRIAFFPGVQPHIQGGKRSGSQGNAPCHPTVMLKSTMIFHVSAKPGEAAMLQASNERQTLPDDD